MPSSLLERKSMATALLTIDEAAERLRIAPRTCREWLRTGKLRGVKYGKIWRIREEDVDAFIQKHLTPGSSSVGEEDGPPAE
jgi:excisionase family DNA binding protein